MDSLALTADQVKDLRLAKVSSWESYAEPGLDFTGFSRQFSSSPSQDQSSQFPLTDLSPTEEHNTRSLDQFDGVLSRNLGLDIMVVVTKTDCMTSLEAEHGPSDQHFDFIQQSIRWN